MSWLKGVLEGEGYESGCYVKPVIIEAKIILKLYKDETFIMFYIS